MSLFRPYVNSYKSIIDNNPGAKRFSNYDLFSTFKTDKRGTIQFIIDFCEINLYNDASAAIISSVQLFATLQDAIVRFPKESWFLQNLINYYIFSNQQQTAKSEALELEQKLRDAVNQTIYVQYLPPFWKVRIGDFRTYDEARDYKKQFVALYPNLMGDTYIVRDKIQVMQ